MREETQKIRSILNMTGQLFEETKHEFWLEKEAYDQCIRGLDEVLSEGKFTCELRTYAKNLSVFVDGILDSFVSRNLTIAIYEEEQVIRKLMELTKGHDLNVKSSMIVSLALLAVIKLDNLYYTACREIREP